MSEYKEFQGKTLDEAIRAACSYYDAPREKLEIEIVSDAKSGIFGLVGVRKATVQARRVHLETLLDNLDEVTPAPRPAKAPRPIVNEQEQPAPARGEAAGGKQNERGASRGRKPSAREVKPEESSASSERGRREQPSKEAQENTAPARPKGSASGRSDKGRPQSSTSKPAPRAAAKPAPKAPQLKQASDTDDGGDELPRVPLSQLDQTLLADTAHEVVNRLVGYVLGETACEVACTDDRVRVSVAADDNSGLLIGKDGQTLASLQYLATRMVSNKVGALVRVQVDAGDYRERQDERLRDLALDLAAKVKANNRPQLTRPLTSYQRRVIHVTLQDDTAVQTHSKGDGELKRVVVTLRRRQDKQDKQGA